MHVRDSVSTCGIQLDVRDSARRAGFGSTCGVRLTSGIQLDVRDSVCTCARRGDTRQIGGRRQQAG